MTIKLGAWGFILSIVLGLYLVNQSFNFIDLTLIPETVNSSIILIAGILLIISGFNHFKKKV